MTRSDGAATAILKSDVNSFLFAGVGTQSNGVELTVLSLLARLGSDPWVEAARLALLPQEVATDWLAERIATIPLSGATAIAARDTAATLVQLLPARTTVDRAVAGAKDQGARTAMWVFGAMVVIATLGMFGTTQHVPSAGSDARVQGNGRLAAQIVPRTPP